MLFFNSAVATVIKRLDKPDITVAVDGSLYRFHPHFHDLMSKKISQLIAAKHKVLGTFISDEYTKRVVV